MKLPSLRIWLRPIYSLAAALMAATASVSAVTISGVPNSHDPSPIVKDGSTYFHFTTGDGIWYSTSTNLTTWAAAPSPVFPNGWPSWINSAVPGFSGQFWAPNCVKIGNYYYLYYACSTFGTKVSAIGVARTTSLTNPNWVDQGMVIQSTASTAFNAIDPGIFVENNGNVYMTFGSFFGGLYVVQINPSTGKILSGSTPTKIAGGTSNASGSDWENPYIMREGPYYYLFANRGACCNGTSSTYRIVYGRSTSITGPYLSQSGTNLNNGDGTTILNSSGRYIGPGSFGLLREGGLEIRLGALLRRQRQRRAQAGFAQPEL